MAAWHDDARFDVFSKCDVFIEDDHYLYVDNQAFNYNGGYTCRECKIINELDGSRSYLWCDSSSADNSYIMSLEKAPWDIAKEIVERDLARWQEIESGLDKWRYEDEKQAPLIEDARRCLMEYNNPNKTFIYC